MSPSKPAPTPAAEPESRYPVTEHFVERATREDVQGVFGGVREQLATVKGPKAEQAKKAQLALSNAEELLGYLIDVRERLIAEQKGAKRR